MMTNSFSNEKLYTLLKMFYSRKNVCRIRGRYVEESREFFAISEIVRERRESIVGDRLGQLTVQLNNNNKSGAKWSQTGSIRRPEYENKLHGMIIWKNVVF